eukprot:Pompholyxophrys_punicea_v1_NODE_165_length_3046_cov_6.146439.p3 type:complete len:115 gc:universal NODE_165_length_3046_cov_6.146439:1858-2202(+)
MFCPRLLPVARVLRPPLINLASKHPFFLRRVSMPILALLNLYLLVLMLCLISFHSCHLNLVLLFPSKVLFSLFTSSWWVHFHSKFLILIHPTSSVACWHMKSSSKTATASSAPF